MAWISQGKSNTARDVWDTTLNGGECGGELFPYVHVMQRKGPEESIDSSTAVTPGRKGLYFSCYLNFYLCVMFVIFKNL